MYDILIVGSGPAGLSAAIYAKRANLHIAVIEKEFEGIGQIAESGRVDNYPGMFGMSGYEMGLTFREHADSLGVQFLEKEVTAIHKYADVFTLVYDDGSFDQTHAVIYAAGAAPRRAGIPGEEEYAGNGVSYCVLCDGSFYSGRTAAVMGGGDTALDSAMYLSELCSKVYLIHRREEFRGAASTVEKLRGKGNVEMLLGKQVQEITGDEEPNGLVLSDGSKVAADGVFVAYGSIPQTALIAELAECDAAGYAIAGEDCATSCPGLYVAGDARTKALRQIVTAVADGANAATAAAAYLNTL